ncbi:MAG TPA: hypothetical protein VHD91_08675 [Gaiellaceae bacterium]|nr:hypothetical protein [Gaiellaceae bacterium]
MAIADDGLGRLLERLPVPDSSPEFFAELDERMRRQDRTSARRWRIAATALAALAISAVAAAAALAATLTGGSVVDQALSCPVHTKLQLEASARIPGKPIPSELSVRADETNHFLMIWTDPQGYSANGKLCKKTPAKLPLAASGLHPDVVLRAGDWADFSVQCPFSGHVLLHSHVHRNASGDPTSAEVSVWRQASPKPKPLAYFRWTPSLTRTYLSPACRADL